MASSAAKKCSFLFLLTLLFLQQIQARDSQFFNKVSSSTTTTTTTNDNVVPNNGQPLTDNQQQEPNFQPENENGYGLYGHESGQLPPSATTTKGEPAAATTTDTSTYNNEFKEPQHKYLPKNYNPVAYVTEPEDINDSNSFAEETYTNNLNNNNNNYYNDAQNYYNNNQQQQDEEETSEPEYRRYTSTNNRYNNNNNYHYNGGSSYNSDPQRLSDTRFMDGATTTRSNSHFYNGGDENKYFQPQGMSDTRSLENGKYFYDVNTERYSHNHPYESLKGVRARNEYNDRNYYGNSENSIGGYQNQNQNQYEFQNEESIP